MIRTCPNCGKIFKAQGTKQQYCCRECANTSPERREKISKTRTAWLATNDGKTTYEQAMNKRNAKPYYQRKDKPEARQRNLDGQRAEYKKWRIAVIKRDNYTCQKCGKRGGILQAHHVKPYKDFPELRHSVDNGITLCLQCHSDEHGYWIHTNRKCPMCGKVFVPLQMKQECCSNRCAADKRKKNAAPKPLHVCENCGTEFRGHRYGKQKFCCRQCYWAWMNGKPSNVTR